MAKESVLDWDVDPNQNEDVGNIDIRQSALGANIGSGLREIMAQIKEFILSASFPGVVTSTALYVSSGTPAIRLIETDAATDKKIFRVVSTGGDTFFQSMTDAEAGGANALVFRRGTGTAWESVDVPASLLQLATGPGTGIRFIGDNNTGVGQLVDDTVSLFAGNGAVPRLTASSTAVDIARNTTITGNFTVTGKILAADGTALAPSISFAGDTDTGIYRPAADRIGFTTAGEVRAKFTETGLFFIASNNAYDGSINDVGFNFGGVSGRAIQASADTTNPLYRINGTTASTYFPMGFYYQAVQKGSIQTTSAGTAFNTTSDERLKDFIGEYDPATAIAIIRADPVRHWNWKNDGGHSVGWGAQTSFEVSPDLASPGNDKAIDDPDCVPWGVDQGRRTPYLWAALSWALDKIEELETRIAALEA